MIPIEYTKNPTQRAATTCRRCGATGLWWYLDTAVMSPRLKKWHLFDEQDDAHLCRPTTAFWMDRKHREFEATRRKQEPLAPFKDIGREGSHAYFREAWTFLPESTLPEDKVFLVERLRYLGGAGKQHFSGASGGLEYRISYFIRRPNGAWTFGQYCPLIPVDDLQPLLDKAKSEGTIL